ncbi:hypothetical protein [Acetobacter oryzoeni]|uniref:Uncharacterized protein n=1 Tax=Acetobacter oryzoeni TaxID=2500548 RepID=A0A5B9GKZ3_9PROT|nr:hypothetical protein [Acetobacter oryzoeni]MCP1203679.1 hypothetical protein [Acetobacter oryzoeni]QEE86931.1 hypothetical protein EOV40_014615 [Acetobacter oryzoeni]
MVQALLHIVGLRSEPPHPLQTVLNEKEQAALEQFKKTHDTKFSAKADRAKLDGWHSSRFGRLVDARAKRIQQWNKLHRPEKGRARQEIERLFSSLTMKLTF